MGHNLVALIDDRLNGFKMPEPANATGSLLTPKLAAWPLRGHTALKSISWETLDQLNNFSLLSF